MHRVGFDPCRTIEEAGLDSRLLSLPRWRRRRRLQAVRVRVLGKLLLEVRRDDLRRQFGVAVEGMVFVLHIRQCVWITMSPAPLVTYVFETIEVLVPLLAHLTGVRLLLLHTHRSGIRHASVRVDDREGAVLVLVKLLV